MCVCVCVRVCVCDIALFKLMRKVVIMHHSRGRSKVWQGGSPQTVAGIGSRGCPQKLNVIQD